MRPARGEGSVVVVVVIVVIVVVAVGHGIVRMLVGVLLSGLLARVAVAVMGVVVGVLVAVGDRTVGVVVRVLAHGASCRGLYQPWTGPTSTIGPVGLFEPPAGSMDTANAVISLGCSSFAICVR